MKREDVERAKQIVIQLDSLDDKLETLSSLEKSFENEKAHTPSLCVSEFSYKLNLEVRTPDMQKIYHDTLKSIRKMLESEKKQLEKELASI